MHAHLNIKQKILLCQKLFTQSYYNFLKEAPKKKELKINKWKIISIKTENTGSLCIG